MADTDVRCHGACVYSGCSVVFVIVLLQCNIFKVNRWLSVFPWKSRWSVRFGCLYRCIKCPVGFHDVLGAVGLVSERVVCADMGDAVCASVLLVYLLCRVDRIAHLSRCVVKTIKVQWEQKAEYLIYKQKVGKWP